MCGIAGAAWTAAGRPLEPHTLRRMIDAIRHRGPDDLGQYVSELATPPLAGRLAGAALGFRRLSIIDVACGHQPMANEDGSVWVAFNGEIYNYRALRRRLEGAGHHFATTSDTETLVHLYEDEGAGMLGYLEGMFALAIWDGRRGELLLARDRLGKKPLVYCQEPGRLLFASELKSLLQVESVAREIDPQALDEYLTYQYVPHPRTIFRGIAKLPPAHYAIYRDDRLTVDCYWRPDFSRVERRPAADYRRELRRQLTAAVEKRLQSDVPLGAFLSGGLDSSIVVGLMQSLVGEPVKTFSIGFPVAEYDETSYAREVAQHLGTEHREFRADPQDLPLVRRLAWYFDEPFADSSAIPTWLVAHHTRQHVTVALTGDGGDELFAGYLRYRAMDLAQWYDLLPGGFKRQLAARHWDRLPRGGGRRSIVRRGKRLLAALVQPPARRYLGLVSIFNEARRAELYDERFVARLPDADPAEFLFEALGRSRGRDLVTALALADLVTYLPCDLMTKVDIASMANSLECRQPFLDHHLVELAAAMPIELKYRRGRGKRILLETFGDLLPARVQRRGKMGFGVPLERWFRHEWRDFLRATLLADRALERGYFRPEVVARLVDEHQSGSVDHSYRLWALLVLELWHQQWIDQAPALDPPAVEPAGVPV